MWHLRACAPRESIVVDVGLLSNWIAKLTKRRLKRGVRHPLIALQAAGKRLAVAADVNPKPFWRTNDPDEITATVRPGDQAFNRPHENI